MIKYGLQTTKYLCTTHAVYGLIVLFIKSVPVLWVLNALVNHFLQC